MRLCIQANTVAQVAHTRREVPYPDADLGCCTSIIGVFFLVHSLRALLGAVNCDDALVEEILGKGTNWGT